jgi:cytosine deaminase
MVDLLIRNASIQDCGEQIDIAVDGGRIVSRGKDLSLPSNLEIDLKGRLLIPGFVDSHVHLDIALMNEWDRPGRARPFRYPQELNEEVERRRKFFTFEDFEQRGKRAIELACRHGVTAIRAQCHVDPEVGLRHLEALIVLREKFRHLVDLQIVAFPQQGFFGQPNGLGLFREAFLIGADVMGCASNLERGQGIDFRQHLDAALDLAMELDVDLDVHADLGIPWHVELNDLEIVHLARRVKERGYEGRVAAGHLCALGSATPDVAEQAITMIRDAQIGVISMPDMYRLARDDTHHVRRGLTRVKELLSAGVNVAFASNNVRDAYRPLGNFNLLEEGLILAYGAHMDSVEELETLLKMCTVNAAKIMKLEDYGLEVGCRADFVVLDAYYPSAAIVNQAEKLLVFKSGQLVAVNRVTHHLIHGHPSESDLLL